jgi:antitoxin component YwqK of YwqJK toxin-antitoxin module
MEIRGINPKYMKDGIYVVFPDGKITITNSGEGGMYLLSKNEKAIILHKEKNIIWKMWIENGKLKSEYFLVSNL